MQIVIIGLGTAAFSAILAIRKLDRESTITVIDKKGFHLQHSCGLPYAIEKKIDVLSLEHTIDAKNLKVNIIGCSEATSIDVGKREVHYDFKGESRAAKYDKLLLDTGSVPFIPPITGIDADSVYCIKDTSDVKDLDRKIASAKNAAVIGAGAIGIETAIALKERGLSVTILEALPSLFPRAIDADMSSTIQTYLEQKGIKVSLGAKIIKVDKKEIVLESSKIAADIVICATGVRPNIKLASDASIAVCKNGIIVDDGMKTSAENIFAAGDCVEIENPISKTRMESQLATTAYRQGTIAGENICGKNTKYNGSISTFVSVIGDIEVASTGLNLKQAQDAGFTVVAGKSSGTDKPEWFNKDDKISFKVLADKKTGKVIGAQAVGKNAFSRINVISTAIFSGLNLDQIRDVELSYCPAVSQAYDVMQQAVDFAIRRM